MATFKTTATAAAFSCANFSFLVCLLSQSPLNLSFEVENIDYANDDRLKLAWWMPWPTLLSSSSSSSSSSSVVLTRPIWRQPTTFAEFANYEQCRQCTHCAYLLLLLSPWLCFSDAAAADALFVCLLVFEWWRKEKKNRKKKGKVKPGVIGQRRWGQAVWLGVHFSISANAEKAKSMVTVTGRLWAAKKFRTVCQ